MIVRTDDGAPARLRLPIAAAVDHPLVDLCTAAEQRARSSRCYVRTSVGERLRVTSAGPEIRQADPVTGLEVISRIETLGDSAIELRHTVRNGGSRPVTLTAVTSFGFRIRPGAAEVTWAESSWLAEQRWRTEPLRDHLPDVGLPLHDQDGRGRWAVTSHGSWSTGEHLPIGVLSVGDQAVGWELATSSPWLWECGEALDGVHVTGLGPTGTEHGFAVTLAPGDEFAAAPALLAWSDRGRDGAVAALTVARRARRQATLGGLPVVYNDFMNTLMGDPSTEKVVPLIDAAAEAGAEVFCVDAGWFADGGDWWHTVGAWREAPGRFTGGLRAVLGHIRARGMTAGLWLEPEAMGTGSPAAAGLPDDAYLRRHGERIVEHERYHLDFRHPAVRERLDEVVDRLVTELGVGYLKLDYNIDPGAADGLLEHGRAYRDWLRDLGRRHPALLIENCASGGMRADAALLQVSSIQSTSDQQDHLRYAAIAAAAPMSIPPEQAGNWAYPSVEMPLAETAFAMLGGIAGRLYLSGFLHRLDENRRALVAEGVRVHRRWRTTIAEAAPSWPLGLPGRADTALALRLDNLLAVWSRGHDAEVLLPGVTALEQLYPAAAPSWPATPGPDGLWLRLPGTVDARLYLIRTES
ncbi:glycoside hydrolase family 36 protein [Actinoplanes sp. NPDC026619]|uniref:alpha-galactosidase n=1 Tax=Actinoplanes sp. NPDC026619 TaxID=3155798 RepID=UPI0033C092C2